MDLDRKNRRQLRLQGYSFAILFLAVIGLLGWLSTRYDLQADWTAAGRHTLSPASVAVLQQIKGPVTIRAFARRSELSTTRKQIKALVHRYQEKKPDIALRFIDPDLAPAQVRKYGVTMDGELVVSYDGRHLNLQNDTEQGLTNTLLHLARGKARKLVFIQGHGERNPTGHANRDLGTWSAQLKNKGFTIATVNLAQHPSIPKNTRVLVIGDPQVALLPGELKVIAHYIKAGGNLLWLADRDQSKSLAPLAKQLGVHFDRGIIVDPTTQLLGIRNPAFAVISSYLEHPITAGLHSITLFPRAIGVEVNAPQGWKAKTLFRTADNSWSETGPISGTISYNAGKDILGPLAVAVAMTRPEPGSTPATPQSGHDKSHPPVPSQRVVVVGDGDFLSNTYLGNGANLDLGNRIVNWLAHDDSFIRIPPKTAPDTHLTLTPFISGVLGFGFLVVLPGLLLAAGVWIWLRRRKR